MSCFAAGHAVGPPARTSGSGMAAHPPASDPGKPSRPPPHPPTWLQSVKAVLTWRAPAAARSPDGRVDGRRDATTLQGRTPGACGWSPCARVVSGADSLRRPRDCRFLRGIVPRSGIISEDVQHAGDLENPQG